VDRVPVWAAPLALLLALALGASAGIALATGGREIATDAPFLLELVRDPLALFGNYRAEAMLGNFGSFPPLLPLGFGLLVAPWTWIASDFWAVRLGALGWCAALLLASSALLARVERAAPGDARLALFVLAALPMLWGTASLLPQEEAYVALFPLALYALAARGRRGWIPPLLVLAVVGAKYFLLVLLLPLAFSGPRPWRDAFAWGAVVAAVLSAYVGYHELRHQLMPILSHRVAPTMSVTFWGLVWHLGVQPPVRAVGLGGVALAGGASFAFALAARRARLPLPHAMAATLWITLLFLATTAPGYAIWPLGLTLACLVRAGAAGRRPPLIALLCCWTAGEWVANLTRGVSLSLREERGAASAFARRVEALLGAGFPFDLVHVAAMLLVCASGVALVAWLWDTGKREARAASA
jgi:hypothetical protein